MQPMNSGPSPSVPHLPFVPPSFNPQQVVTPTIPPQPQAQPQPPQQQWQGGSTLVFHNVSPISVQQTAQFKTSGHLDDKSLPEMTQQPRFKYTRRLDQSALGAISGVNMASFSSSVVRNLSSGQSSELSQYQSWKTGKTAQEKATNAGPVRALHHQVKSDDKLRSHYQAVGLHKHQAGSDQDQTEAGGEFAAARWMRHMGYEMKFGFKKGTGIDQIWVKRDGSGNIIEYVIVEAKGWGVNSGVASSLSGTADKGWQMSPRWVYLSLMEFATTTTNAHLNRMAQKIIEAIERNTALVWGVCLTEQSDRNAVEVLDCGPYNVHPNQQLLAANSVRWQ